MQRVFGRVAACAVVMAAIFPACARAQPNFDGIPEQQLKICELATQYATDTQEYAAKKSQLNPIQQSTLPPPTPARLYDEKALQILGTSGAFKDWKGQLQYDVSDYGKGPQVRLVFMAYCPPPAQRWFQMLQLPASYVNPNLQPFKPEYGAVPLSDPVAKVVASIPSKPPLDNIVVSGHFAYLPPASNHPAGYIDANGNLGQVISGGFLAHFSYIKPQS